jgi:two-component system, NarL family, response regulator DevR
MCDADGMAGTGGGRLGSVRVFLVDDHEMVRRGLRDLFEEQPDMVVVGEAATAADAVPAIGRLVPDVAVLDARLPDGDGVDVCRDVRSAHPQVACLMFTSYDDEDAIIAAIMAGAAGYLLKQIRGVDLIDAVRRVAAGQSLLDPAVTATVLARLRSVDVRPSDPLAALSDQERRVLALISEGLTNREIGQRLYLAEKTVKNYVSSLLAKLGLGRRAQAAALAATVSQQQSGLSRPPAGGAQRT